VSFSATDRGGLERLCRYVLRRGDWGATGLRARALALGRLERLPDGRVRLGLKRAWSDGTTGIELSALEFVEKLAAIIPPPRANQTLYAGVLAGNASERSAKDRGGAEGRDLDAGETVVRPRTTWSGGRAPR
jgi:hypothetical protein